jgi:hypothetical protein
MCWIFPVSWHVRVQKPYIVVKYIILKAWFVLIIKFRLSIPHQIFTVQNIVESYLHMWIQSHNKSGASGALAPGTVLLGVQNEWN